METNSQKGKPCIYTGNLLGVHELNDCVRAMDGLRKWMIVFYPDCFPKKEKTKFTDVVKKVMLIL